MTVKHLDHLNMTVTDFNETAIWYSKVFGFSVVEEGIRNGNRWGILKSGEALLCVCENPTRHFYDGDELENKQLHGINHFSFRIDDQESWENTVRRENLLEILLELRASGASKLVLPDFDYEHASRSVRRLAKQADVKPIRFHDLRHTFASNFLMSGGSIYKLQKMLGHTTLQMTERYSHLSPEHLNGATEMLDFGSKESGNVVTFRNASDGEEKSGHKMATKKIPDENFVSEFKNLENRGGGN